MCVSASEFLYLHPHYRGFQQSFSLNSYKKICYHQTTLLHDGPGLDCLHLLYIDCFEMYSNNIARLFSMYVSIKNKPVSSKTSSKFGYNHVPSSKGLICFPLKYHATLIWKLLIFLPSPSSYTMILSRIVALPVQLPCKSILLCEVPTYWLLKILEILAYFCFALFNCRMAAY